MSTSPQTAAADSMLIAIAEAVREAREIPSGTIYAILAGKVGLAGYESALRILTRAGLIDVSPSHMIRWTGPRI